MKIFGAPGKKMDIFSTKKNRFFQGKLDTLWKFKNSMISVAFLDFYLLEMSREDLKGHTNEQK